MSDDGATRLSAEEVASPHLRDGRLPDNPVSLANFENSWFQRGRPLLIELLWQFVEAIFVRSWIPGSAHRIFFLRLFGARIGKGVVIKPRVQVKFPWRLRIGDHCWIGESVWLDNLAQIDIGSDCCLSQGAYLCTGSHDWASPKFGLVVKPISVGNCAWIAAKAMIAPGIAVGEGAVLALGSTALTDLESWTIYRGIPAVAVGKREISTSVSSS